MNPSKQITIQHVKEAIAVIKKGGKYYDGLFIKYKQTNFCGTACCVWGHAAIISGKYTPVEISNKLKRVELMEDFDAWEIGGNYNDPDYQLKKYLAWEMGEMDATPESLEKVFLKHGESLT